MDSTQQEEGRAEHSELFPRDKSRTLRKRGVGELQCGQERPLIRQGVVEEERARIARACVCSLLSGLPASCARRPLYCPGLLFSAGESVFGAVAGWPAGVAVSCPCHARRQGAPAGLRVWAGPVGAGRPYYSFMRGRGPACHGVGQPLHIGHRTNTRAQPSLMELQPRVNFLGERLARHADAQ
ncbi:unnamed protein product [Amoebophrya sp. A120]|nr:unnamed protein product [Amoebophrya sp. A120]|eukprot:GSA120T00019275001.1